jgi:hypothetical protein
MSNGGRHLELHEHVHGVTGVGLPAGGQYRVVGGVNMGRQRTRLAALAVT